MKRLFLSIILIMGVLTVSTVYAASGYKAILDYQGTTVGIIIYYDNSVSDYVSDINDTLNEIFPSFAQYDVNVTDYNAITAEEVLQIANNVINYGSSYYNWNYCFGFLVYKSKAYDTNVIKCDVFVLGLRYGGLSIPFMYVGSFDVNEMLQYYLEF